MWLSGSRHTLLGREAFVTRHPVLSFNLRQFSQLGSQKFFTPTKFDRVVLDSSVEFVLLSQHPIKLGFG